MSRSALKYRAIQPVEKFFVNPPVRLAWRLGFGPPGDAFWLVVQHGRRTDCVRNIEANPHARVRSGSRAAWRTGMAYVLDDDPDERVRILGQDDPWRRLCVGASKAMGTDLLTVRIDLDPL
jgi:hypothetical protein